MSLSKTEQKQYNRHLILKNIGESGQLKLKEARVLIIGAGGLGCPILQYLTAAGVGTIGIIDHDKVDQSNLQRQVLYTHDDIGEYKVKAAINKLKALNPYITFNAYKFALNTSNALNLFNQYDIVVDGSDNFQTRYLANDAATITNKPLVFGSIYQFEGQVSVFNYLNGPTYRCLFPSPPGPNEVPNCSEIGVLGVLPGVIGSMQANEVIKMITGIGEVLSGKLLTYNMLTNAQTIIRFKKNTNSVISNLEADYDVFCGVIKNEFELNYQDIENELDDYLLIDVRETWEREEFNIGGIHISLYELNQHVESLDTAKPILLYCQSGSRSKTGKQLLDDLLPNSQVFTLKEGIHQLQK